MNTLDKEEITANGEVLAIVVRNTFNAPGCTFVTPNNFFFQLGFHNRKSQEHIEPHDHIPFKELKNVYPQEFFYVEKGKIKVGIYHKKIKQKDVILEKGDVLLVHCAHDMTFLEDSKILELKQGPYRGRDAEKFSL